MKILEVTLPRVMKFEGGNRQMLNISLHTQFHYLQYGLVKAVDQTKLKIPVTVMNAWDTTIGAQTKLVEQSAVSERTAKMLALDNERDNLLDGIFHVVSGLKYSPTEATREAGLRLEAKLKPYTNLRSRPFEMESVGIRGLEDDMKTKTADIAAVGLTDVLTRLHTVNEEYEKLRTDRRIQTSDEKLPTAQQVRPLTDAAYDVVCQYIQSAYLNATSDEDRTMPEELVAEMNRTVVKFRTSQREEAAQKRVAKQPKDPKPKDPKQPKDPKDPKDPKTPKDPKDPKPKKPGKDDGSPDIHLPEEEGPKKPGGGEGESGKKPEGGGTGGTGGGDSGDPDIHLPEE